MSEPRSPPPPTEPLKEGGLKTPTTPEPADTTPGGEPGDDRPDREGGMIGEG